MRQPALPALVEAFCLVNANDSVMLQGGQIGSIQIGTLDQSHAILYLEDG